MKQKVIMINLHKIKIEFADRFEPIQGYSESGFLNLNSHLHYIKQNHFIGDIAGIFEFFEQIY